MCGLTERRRYLPSSEGPALDSAHSYVLNARAHDTCLIAGQGAACGWNIPNDREASAEMQQSWPISKLSTAAITELSRRRCGTVYHQVKVSLGPVLLGPVGSGTERLDQQPQQGRSALRLASGGCAAATAGRETRTSTCSQLARCCNATQAGQCSEHRRPHHASNHCVYHVIA